MARMLPQQRLRAVRVLPESHLRPSVPERDHLHRRPLPARLHSAARAVRRDLLPRRRGLRERSVRDGLHRHRTGHLPQRAGLPKRPVCRRRRLHGNRARHLSRRPSLSERHLRRWLRRHERHARVVSRRPGLRQCALPGGPRLHGRAGPGQLPGRADLQQRQHLRGRLRRHGAGNLPTGEHLRQRQLPGGVRGRRAGNLPRGQGLRREWELHPRLRRPSGSARKLPQRPTVQRQRPMRRGVHRTNRHARQLPRRAALPRQRPVQSRMHRDQTGHLPPGPALRKRGVHPRVRRVGPGHVPGRAHLRRGHLPLGAAGPAQGQAAPISPVSVAAMIEGTGNQ